MRIIWYIKSKSSINDSDIHTNNSFFKLFVLGVPSFDEYTLLFIEVAYLFIGSSYNKTPHLNLIK